MSSALLDAPRVPAVPRARRRTATGVRPPVSVVAGTVVAVLEALGLLALALTGLDGVIGAGVRPSGVLVALCLLVLAGWVVLCAGGGANLLDGAGRTLLTAVACGEIVLLLVLTIAGVLGADGVWLVALGPLGALPVPALALLALGLPTGKLLLASTPSATAWLQAGGRPAAPRPAPVTEHRVLRVVTLACIGLALAGVAVTTAPAGADSAPSTAAVTAP